jgi:Xaa-Pro dipeptidase
LPQPRDSETDIRLQAGEPQGRGLMPSSTSLGVSIQGNDEVDPDLSAPVLVTCQALKDLGLSAARVAFEKNSSFLPYKTAKGFVSRMTDVRWSDAGDLINDWRIVQSPAELQCTRRAAEISDAMVMAGPDVPNRDVAAIVYQTMIQRGGTYPAFVPPIRSTRTMDHEHGTWDNDRLSARDLLFLEMSGCFWRYHAPLGRAFLSDTVVVTENGCEFLTSAPRDLIVR